MKNGHDGTWVVHPALVPVAKEVLTSICLPKIRSIKKFEYHITESQLLEIPKGDITEKESEKISM